MSDHFRGQPPRAQRRLGRYVLAFLTVLACAASIFLLASLTKPVVTAIDREGGTRIILAARAPDGSPPAPQTLSQAEQIIRKRVTGLGLGDAQISAYRDTLTVTVAGDHRAEALGQVGRLTIRPVLHALRAHPLPVTRPGPAGAGRGGLNSPEVSARVASEKKLRQSTSRAIQFLALQFQATRCDQPDTLVDNDDPGLPLITCATDHTMVYLLGPSIIDGNQIRAAESSLDRQLGSYAVDLQFDNTAASTWAQFTAAHAGSNVAYTVDTQVVSAPAITGPIRNGKAQIAGGKTAFTADSAGDLAVVLQSGPLPIPFQTSKSEAVAPKPNSAGLWQTRPPIGLVITALGVVVILLCLQVYLYRAANRGPQYRPAA